MDNDSMKEENKILKKELDFYKSIFNTHQNSAIFNLRIKSINGEKIWIDVLDIHYNQELLNKLDKDEEVLSWLEPIKIEK